MPAAEPASSTFGSSAWPPAAADATPGDDAQVEQELLDAYASEGPVVPVAVLGSALLIVLMAWDNAPRAFSLGWLAAVACVLVIRDCAQRWARRARRVPLSTRMGWSTAVSALGGVTHGASILFWPYLDDLERALQSTYVLALSSGAVAAVIGYMPVFLAYMLPLLVPLIAAWVWVSATGSGSHAFDAAIAAPILSMLSIYVGFLVVLARDTFHRYRESFEARRQLQQALQRAEAANRAKTRFLASASHDLRQPMHTLTLFSAALAMTPLDDRARQIANQMNLALQGLSSQLDALLDVSKLDAGVVGVELRTFALSPFLDTLVAEFGPAARRKGLALHHDGAADARVRTDPMLLERVLRNLLDNAIKYTERGEVALRLRRQGDVWVLAVRDTGIGIPAAEQQRVFEEFYQLGNPERNRSQGLGLGLSIVQRLAELLKLELTLRSEPGLGTEVQLMLPAARHDPAADTAAMPPAPESLVGLRLLVVDDEEQVREGMKVVLEGLGCSVAAVADADAALGEAAARRFDAVLADFRLRGGSNGIDVVRRLRQARADLPALLISGDTAPDRLREADAAGLRLLHKPVPLDVLMRAIRAEVDRRGDQG